MQNIRPCQASLNKMQIDGSTILKEIKNIFYTMVKIVNMIKHIISHTFAETTENEF